MKNHQLLVIQILALASIVSIAEATNPGSPNFHCDLVRELYPDLQWKKLEKGIHLGTYDALLTCRSSTVSLKSNLKFSARIDWKTSAGRYLATIVPDSLRTIQLQIEPKGGQPRIDVEILEVSGEAFYSTNRDLIRKHRLLGSESKTPEEESVQNQKVLDDLKSIGWERIARGRLLDPWDMIWTKNNSRAEIEIVKEGPSSIVDAITDVRSLKGRGLPRKRFPSNSYFIVVPEFHLKAKVTGVIGEVWIAKDREKVRKFWERHHSSLSLGPMDRETYIQWLKDLSNPDFK